VGLREIHKNEFIITNHNTFYYNNIRVKITSGERNGKIINWKGFVENEVKNFTIILLSRGNTLRALKLAGLS
jgi:hypothetical protein